MVIMIRNSLCLIFFFTVFITSCRKQERDNKDSSIEFLNNQKDSIVKEINYKDNFPLEDKFKYPKDKLFLGFYSGMNEVEFYNHADSLVTKKVLYKSENSNNLFYNVSKIMNWPDQINYGILISPKFDSNKNLLSIQLNDIGLFSDVYSKKYKIPYWPKDDRINVSKIGTYNKSYDPLDYILYISDDEQWKTHENKYYQPKTQRLSVPKTFIDKSKTLDLYESQVYYNKNINEDNIKSFEKVIEVGGNTVVFYKKYWLLKTENDLSIPFDQIPLEAQIRYLYVREQQSKQVIETKFWERFIDVIYTTKQYYEDSIRSKNVEISIPVKINRNISDEI